MDAGFAQEVKPYFLNYPYMANYANGQVDGNAILYSGTYALIRYKFDSQEKFDVLEKDVYEAAKVKNGVIARAKKKQDPESHDDYVGLLTLSLLGKKEAAQEIYSYGMENRWSYVNVAYSFSDLFNAQFWRLPGMVQHIKACAGIKWNYLDHFLFALSAVSNAFTVKDSTSGKILTWHMVSAYEIQSLNKSWLSDFAVNFWKSRILKMYPNAMGDVFGIYFGRKHIFAKYMIGKI